MNEVCIFISIFFLICILIGWGQGLFRVMISAAGLVASIIVATYVAPGISGYLEEHTQIDDDIAAYIIEELQFEDKQEELTKGLQIEVIKALPLPEGIKSDMLDNNYSEMYQALDVSSVYEYIAKSIALMIMNASVFMVLILICRIIFFLLGRTLAGLAKLPILKSIDKIGGGILGGMKGIIMIWIFFLFLSITSTTEWSQGMITAVTDNPIYNLLYNNNILLDIVSDLTKVLFL